MAGAPPRHDPTAPDSDGARGRFKDRYVPGTAVEQPGGLPTAPRAGDRLWCRRCDEPGERRDGRFVHTGTGSPEGKDGHRAVPSVTDPANKAEAAAIAEEFGGRWRVMAHLTLFYAAPADGTPLGVDAGTGGELRGRLEAQERIWAMERKAAARRVILR